MNKIKMRVLVDAMSNQNDDKGAYLDRETGDLVTVAHVMVAELQETDEIDERWVKHRFEEVLLARLLITAPDRFVPLPDKREIRDWEIMESFVHSLPSGENKTALEPAIHGKGAFKKFQNAVYELNLMNEWFAHRKQAYQNIARQWAGNRGLEIED